MTDPLIQPKFELGKDFEAVVKRLRGADKTLRKELNTQIREATKPVVADMKSSVLAIDSRVTGRSGANSGASARAMHAGASRANRKRSAGLRQTISRALQTKITTSGYRTGVRIRVDSSKLPADQQTLPQALDSAKGWRHPVFGNRSVWVTQVGKPWFRSVGRKHATGVRAKVAQAVETTAKKLEGK